MGEPFGARREPFGVLTYGSASSGSRRGPTCRRSPV
jgi:hypothetical protein